MGRKKINLIARFLSLGVNVVISDVDVAWLRNPVPFFRRFPGADILTSTDHLTPTVGAKEELERYPDAGSAFNIGIMLFRERSLPFVKKWIQVRRARARFQGGVLRAVGCVVQQGCVSVARGRARGRRQTPPPPSAHPLSSPLLSLLTFPASSTTARLPP